MTKSIEHKRYAGIFIFLALAAIFSLRFSLDVTFSFDIGSERYVNNMIAAGGLDIDVSQVKFGMNILSCDGVIWNGGGKAIDNPKTNDTLYLIWNSGAYINKKAEIARVRNQSVGLQGWFVWLFSRTYHWTHIPLKYYYYAFRLMNILLLALVLTAICFELKKAYSFLFASCFYISCLLSEWISFYAANLYWEEFTWFLPMLLGLICINNPDIRKFIYPMVFFSVAMKSLCNYEYITNVMMCSIVFTLSEYFACSHSDICRKRMMFRMTLGIGFSALAGFLAAILFHGYIRGNGNIMNGLNEIYHADILKRTFGNAGDFSGYSSVLLSNSLNASVLVVLAKYLFRPEGWLALMALILSVISIVYSRYKYGKKVKKDAVLLAISFWSSISWFVLGKSHSYVHTHLNFVLWYIPFIPVAIYVFIKQRLSVLVSDKENQKIILNSYINFLSRLFWLS